MYCWICEIWIFCKGFLDLPYPPSALLSISPTMWLQCVGHPSDEMLQSLFSHNYISCNKEKLFHICHAFQLGKHVWLPFVSLHSIVSRCFEIVHSDFWTSPIVSVSRFKYYVLFLDQFSHYLWIYPIWNNQRFLISLCIFILMFKINLSVILVLSNMTMVVSSTTLNCFTYLRLMAFKCVFCTLRHPNKTVIWTHDSSKLITWSALYFFKPNFRLHFGSKPFTCPHP